MNIASTKLAARTAAPPGPTWRWALLAASLSFGDGALADTPEIFREADLALGERLITEHRCSQCHAQKMGGDGNSIYRPLGRINAAGLLRGQVEQCNSALNLQMFPEEVTSVAAVLNRDHYRFSK